MDPELLLSEAFDLLFIEAALADYDDIISGTLTIKYLGSFSSFVFKVS